MKNQKRTLFWFRQDLRIFDNSGLNEVIRTSQAVLPIFIRDEKSIEDFGEFDIRFGFIREALEDIDKNLSGIGGRLSVYRGKPEKVIEALIQKHGITQVICNESYNPQGKLRDERVKDICTNLGCSFQSFSDFLMIPPKEIECRKVFTPFSLLWKRFLSQHPELCQMQPPNLNQIDWILPEDRVEIEHIFPIPYHPFWTLKFGRERMEKDFSEYDTYRNIPGIDGSTRLSPYIRFGIYSIRQIYAKVQENPTLLSEIIWREFWYHVAHYFPRSYFEEFQEKRRSICWEENDFLWDLFCQGKTGYPIIDAAVRQLVTTSWMHNRLRMVVASFLTKNLGIDWRKGERWFRKYLIDYDEAVNTGNWQWSASVGADPKPIRIFNPILQSERFDPEAHFIKKYIPELQDIDPKRIHSCDLSGIYPRPIVDQRISSNEAKERYKTN